jgi:hypothetical protein
MQTGNVIETHEHVETHEHADGFKEWSSCHHRRGLRRAARGVDSVCSVFKSAMNCGDSLVGFPSRQSVEQVHDARLAKITLGAFAIWLDPFRGVHQASS